MTRNEEGKVADADNEAVVAASSGAMPETFRDESPESAQSKLHQQNNAIVQQELASSAINKP